MDDVEQESFEEWVERYERWVEEDKEERLLKQQEEENKIHLGGE